MKFEVNKIFPEAKFYVNGASYAGNPRNNTIMFISMKVSNLIEKIEEIKECVIFLENGIDTSTKINRNNIIKYSDNPQFEYTKFANIMANETQYIEKRKKYRIMPEGFYLGEDTEIGENAYIEPGVVIGHGVKIGNDAIILAGSVIKHAIIGDYLLCNENAVIGNYSFAMTEDSNGNKIRIPTLGRVIIGNNVEIGACNDIACGTCGDTILENNVKLDSLVHVGHEVHLYKNVEITAGVIIAGFVNISEGAYAGINSSIRNRINLGENCFIGMGSNVIKDVEDNSIVAGNPAKVFPKMEI